MFYLKCLIIFRVFQNQMSTKLIILSKLVNHLILLSKIMVRKLQNQSYLQRREQSVMNMRVYCSKHNNVSAAQNILANIPKHSMLVVNIQSQYAKIILQSIVSTLIKATVWVEILIVKFITLSKVIPLGTNLKS